MEDIAIKVEKPVEAPANPEELSETFECKCGLCVG